MTNISGRDRGVNRLRDLTVANARLLQLREQFAKSKSHKEQKSTYNVEQAAPAADPVEQIVTTVDSVEQTAPVTQTAPTSDPITQIPSDSVEADIPFEIKPVVAEKTTNDPPKSGWLSPLSKRLEELHHQLENPPDEDEEPLPEPIPYSESATIRVYPSILAGVMTEELTTAGRVWLLARYIDQPGRGWIKISRLREALTAKNSPLRIFSWRRLRQVMTKGDDIFWERDDSGRMWIRSNKKVAIKLDLIRLTGKSVHLPIKGLIGNIADAKAAFYASFHAGRPSSPISRVVLRTITGVPERTQLTYEERTGITAKRNIALGHAIQLKERQHLAYKDRHAYFVFNDLKGIFGPEGQKYHARQLPNSYTCSYETARSRQQKRINQALKADLVTQEALGNSYQISNPFKRTYFLNAKKACRASSFDGTLYLFEKTQGKSGVWNRM